MTHDWAPTGLWIDGKVCFPCQHRGCEAGLRQNGGGRPAMVVDGLFPSRIGCIELTILDHPKGSVAKTVIHELSSSYLLQAVTFREGDIAIDIGAHVGIVSIYLAKRWPGIRVYAFEPVPENFARLQANIQANNADGISGFQLAVSGKGGNVQLTGNLEENSGGFSEHIPPGSGTQTHTAESVTLTQILEQLHIPRCRLLKIDCEGAEYGILTAARESLRRIDYLSGEFHINKRLADAGQSPAELLDICEQYIKPECIHVTTCRMGD